MSTEKLDNVVASKLGNDANGNEVEAPPGFTSGFSPITWTGIIKEKPEPYIHPQSGDPNGQFLIQIQPTRLKDPVWVTAGWTAYPQLTKKGIKIQFHLDPSPENTLTKNGTTIVAESRWGTMASGATFEYRIQGQGIHNSKGAPKDHGKPHRDPAWIADMAFE